MVLSPPLLANIALHGLEEHLAKFIQTLKIPDTGCATRRWMEKSRKVSSRSFASHAKFGIIRYADDFVVLHEQKWVVLALKTEVIRFLKGIGLELSETKTRLKHTLVLQNDDTKEEGFDGNIGFDFLGFTFRHFHSKYRSAFDSKGRPLGHTLLIYPSKEKCQSHRKKLHEIIFKQGKALRQEALIKKLNPVISGWSRYFGVSDANSMHILSKMDQVLFLQLQRWAYRRSKKGKKESVRKYWRKMKNRNWIFATENETLVRHTDYSNPITQYVKVKADSSPFNGETIYWTKRLRTNPFLSIRVCKLLSLQQGKCKFCNVTFKDGDIMEVDHIIPTAHGGKDSYNNLQLLHGHCHDTKTAQDRVQYSQTDFFFSFAKKKKSAKAKFPSSRMMGNYHVRFRMRGWRRIKTTPIDSTPVILLDKDGIVRADVTFRRAESKYSIEQVGVSVTFFGGELDGVSFNNPTTVKKYARRAQLGEIFEFDRSTLQSDGVFRSSPRGWFTFGHLSFALLFFFGHIWHGARTIFRDVFAGIDEGIDEQIEFGAFLKLGDDSTRRQSV